MHNKIAHSAEHAFIGSLQYLTGKTLNVRKVEHRKTDNSVFITIPNLDLELIIRAESEVNSLINMGKKIITHSFESLTEAKECLPSLRANEERIIASNPVRVVEIEGHDLAACAMEHVENLNECIFFLVTRMSKNGKDYEISFVVGEQAKETAIALSLKLLKICEEIEANFNTVENTIRKLKTDREIYLGKLKNLTKEKLDSIVPYITDSSKITIIRGIFFNLLDEEIRIFAGRKIAESNSVVVIVANINNHNDDTASVVFARNKSLVNIDCNKLFREISSKYGQGGGTPHFVTGVVDKERVTAIVNNVIAEVMNRSL
jgi:alanyl-tRNA synthetase